ncbi:hypothetical protein M405DRAFT_886006 [Rhizopogon salebrosus TDB-379]|nr:hypothetical protein M405DRAFT_886006 [Rhizopogon salebrosus TDB-379]
MISGIVPRPIAFVSTISEQGVENLSPFSWFNMVTNHPPIISFACNDLGPGSLKNTATNVMNSQGFTVNIINEPFIENANATPIDAPPDFDEWSISGLTKEKCVQVKAFSMECEISRTRDGRTQQHILAHIKYIHVRKDMLTERGGVDLTKFKPVARMGDISYARAGDAFRLTRPAWAQEKATIHDTLTTLATL